MNRSTRRGLAIAVTGGIACGKSEAGRRLAELGFVVVDADDLAREVVKPGSAELAAIESRFGPGMVRADGMLDRARLARRVFADAAERRALESIVHPPVMRAIRDRVARETAEGRDAAALVPLLFEIGATDGWDAILCIAASEATVMARLRARGLTDDESRSRLAAQWPVAEKAARTPWTIWNDGTLEAFRSDVARTIQDIRERTDHG